MGRSGNEAVYVCGGDIQCEHCHQGCRTHLHFIVPDGTATILSQLCVPAALPAARTSVVPNLQRMCLIVGALFSDLYHSHCQLCL